MIRMYDGKYYSEDEIKTVSPELYEFRLHHETLEEILNLDDVKSNTTRYFTAIYFLLAPGFVALWITGSAFGYAFAGYVGAVLTLGIPITLFVWLVSEWHFSIRSKAFPRTVRIQNSVVFVSVSGSGTSFVLDGRPVFRSRFTWNDRTFPCMLFHKCFLIRYNFGNSIAVGLKPEMYPVFDGFFRLIQSDLGKVKNTDSS